MVEKNTKTINENLEEEHKGYSPIKSFIKSLINSKWAFGSIIWLIIIINVPSYATFTEKCGSSKALFRRPFADGDNGGGSGGGFEEAEEAGIFFSDPLFSKRDPLLPEDFFGPSIQCKN